MHANDNIWLPEDVAIKLQSDFPQELLSTLQALLEVYKGNEQLRVLRCIIQLAEGDKERLLHFIRAAQTDHRDVIYWAEYDQNDQRLRDCNKPFEVSNSSRHG
jgi:hypothetical protein